MIQDVPVDGTLLTAGLLTRMARAIPNVACSKIETPQAPARLRNLIAQGHPVPMMHPATRGGLLEIARRLDPVVLRWGR